MLLGMLKISCLKNIFHRTLLICVCFICNIQPLSSQGAGQHKNKFVRKLQKTLWIAGLSGAVVDDDAKAFKDVFDVKNNWNFLYYPSKINLEGFIINGVSIEGAVTYSQLKKGKLLGQENSVRQKNVNLIAFDLNGKLYPNDLSGAPETLSPYVISGLGYTFRALAQRRSAITFNIGFGLNLWILKGLGLTVQSTAKFALNNASSKNYLQHSLGLIYRFSLLKSYRATAQGSGHRYNLFKNN